MYNFYCIFSYMLSNLLTDLLFSLIINDTVLFYM